MSSEDFGTVFEELRKILKAHEAGLAVRKDLPDHYYVDHPPAASGERDLFFGAVQIMKNYVSFHLMPVYMYPDLLEGASPGLMKRMQGKSCFNFKRVEPDTFEELRALTERSYQRATGGAGLGK